jgi:hypothetical protein
MKQRGEQVSQGRYLTRFIKLFSSLLCFKNIPFGRPRRMENV